jgi:hypothetical protein
MQHDARNIDLSICFETRWTFAIICRPYIKRNEQQRTSKRSIECVRVSSTISAEYVLCFAIRRIKK